MPIGVINILEMINITIATAKGGVTFMFARP